MAKYDLAKWQDHLGGTADVKEAFERARTAVSASVQSLVNEPRPLAASELTAYLLIAHRASPDQSLKPSLGVIWDIWGRASGAGRDGLRVDAATWAALVGSAEGFDARCDGWPFVWMLARHLEMAQSPARADARVMSDAKLRAWLTTVSVLLGALFGAGSALVARAFVLPIDEVAVSELAAGAGCAGAGVFGLLAMVALRAQRPSQPGSPRP
jgi:hypothetical protein